eukprot:gene47335-63442_t
MFTSLHTLFMTQYTELWTAVDPVAERIRSLGHAAPGSYAQFGKLSSVPDAPATPPKAMEMVRILVEGHEAVARTARELFAVVDKAGLIWLPMVAATSHAPSRLSLYLDLIRWNRPAGWLLLLWPSLSALWVAAGGFPGWHLLAVFVLGTILMRSAGCCVNDVADREFDKHVKRTAQRPVTSGKVSTREALALGAALALVAFALVLTTNTLTVFMSFAALAITVAYPYAKRYVSMPQAVLGVAFSFGVPMAFAAVQAQVPPLAWVLLLGNLFWVLAYDTEYAM